MIKKINENITPKQLVDNPKFWAIYAVSFYERLLQKLKDSSIIKSVYRNMMMSDDLTLEDKKGLTFFYKIRMAEIIDPDFWDKVSGKVEENKEYNMKAKLVKDSLVEYGGGSPGPMGGPMAGSQNYDSEERELVSRIGELESAIWNSGRPKLISAWDNFSDGLLSGAESMYPEDDEYENGEEIQEPYWNDLDDSDLEYAIQHAEGLLLSADLSQEQLPDNLREAKDEDGDGYCDMCGAKLKKGKCDICAGEGLGKMIDAGKKLQAKKKKLVKEYYTPEDQIDDRLAVAKEKAQKISAEEGVGQHVNEVRPGVYRVEDWFDSDATVASYENGREIG